MPPSYGRVASLGMATSAIPRCERVAASARLPCLESPVSCAAWMTLGLRLAPPTSQRHALGWEIRHNQAGAVLLGARSRIGMPAELLVTRHDGALLFDTFVQHNNPVARAVWAAIEPTHERVVPAILRQFRRRVLAEAP
jgi:hypothetical protein